MLVSGFWGQVLAAARPPQLAALFARPMFLEQKYNWAPMGLQMEEETKKVMPPSEMEKIREREVQETIRRAQVRAGQGGGGQGRWRTTSGAALVPAGGTVGS